MKYWETLGNYRECKGARINTNTQYKTQLNTMPYYEILRNDENKETLESNNAY